MKDPIHPTWRGGVPATRKKTQQIRKMTPAAAESCITQCIYLATRTERDHGTAQRYVQTNTIHRAAESVGTHGWLARFITQKGDEEEGSAVRCVMSRRWLFTGRSSQIYKCRWNARAPERGARQKHSKLHERAVVCAPPLPRR